MSLWKGPGTTKRKSLVLWDDPFANTKNTDGLPGMSPTAQCPHAQAWISTLETPHRPSLRLLEVKLPHGDSKLLATRVLVPQQKKAGAQTRAIFEIQPRPSMGQEYLHTLTPDGSAHRGLLGLLQWYHTAAEEHHCSVRRNAVTPRPNQ